MRSILNSLYQVDEEYWVVSVVRKGDHAVLVFETIGHEYYQDEGHCILWFDFMPHSSIRGFDPLNYGNDYANFSSLVNERLNPFEEKKKGKVRMCPRPSGKVQLNSPLTDIWKKHVSLTTKSKLCAYLGWAEDCTTFRESKDKVELVLASVRSDLNRLPDSSNPLYFRLDGGDGTENGPRNCLTWCIDKLKSGNIDCNQLSRWAVNDILAIRPVNHIGSDRDNCFIL